MNEKTVTEVIASVHPNPTTISIMLNPQPSRDTVCDNSSTITNATGETALSNVSPSSCDSESLILSQMMVKKSLKLDLTHNNNEMKSTEIGSPSNDDDASFKSQGSPSTCKNLF